MPRLGSFLVCEKIIIDQQQKPTLISLFQAIAALVPEGQSMPKDTIGGNSWAVFCEWFFEDDESVTKNFEQVIEVSMPDGTPSAIRGRLPFKEIAKNGQGTRAFINLFGMPISQVGSLTINAWIESNAQRVTETFKYHIRIEHTTQLLGPDSSGMRIPALSQTKPI